MISYLGEELETIKTDVLVLGGGSSGVAAALGAARAGAETIILERSGYMGGMATSAYVGTICGLYYRSKNEPRFGLSGLAREIGERLAEDCQSAPCYHEPGLWFLPYNPFVLTCLFEKLCTTEQINIKLHSVPTATEVKDGVITSIDCLGWREKFKIRPKMVIDCSGESIISTLCQSAFEQELVDRGSNTHQAGAIVFELSNVKSDSERLAGQVILMALIEAARNSVEYEDLSYFSVVPGSLIADRLLIKLTLPELMHGDEDCVSHAELVGRQRVERFMEFLRLKVPEFSSCKLGSVAPQVGVRSSNVSIGGKSLSVSDVLECHRFDDGVARGLWPIEYWSNSRKPEMQYFAENGGYDIPIGCLTSAHIKNLFFAGRHISAEPLALASARVIGTCLSTGVAAGRMAGYLCGGLTEEQSINNIQKIELC